MARYIGHPPAQTPYLDPERDRADSICFLSRNARQAEAYQGHPLDTPGESPSMTTDTIQPAKPSSSAKLFATTIAVLVVALLAFTAYAKFVYPSAKPVIVEGLNITLDGKAFDRGIALFEVLILIGLLAFHRFAWVWLLNALFFGALAGYSCFKSWHGESCGCAGGLVEFPKYFMFGVDVVVVILSLAVAGALGASRVLLPVTLVGAILAGGAGWLASDATTPPKRTETAVKYEGKLAHERLFESPVMEDIRLMSVEEDAAAWLIFCHDPTCHICEAMKPVLEFHKDGLEESLDPVLQIRMFSIPDLEKDEKVKIEAFAWETPTLFVVQNGKITKKWSGKELEGFSEADYQKIYDTCASGGYPETP